MGISKLDCYRCSGPERLILTNPKTKYTVDLNVGVEPTSYKALSIHHPIQYPRNTGIVTGRDMPDYIEHCGYDADFERDDQFIEVGAGLGQFLPLMVEKLGSRLAHKPIVIDPVDYRHVQDHLQAILDQYGDHPVVRSLESRMKEFIGRCSILLGPDIIHIRETLSSAIRLHPEEIIGKADVVIGLCGPMTHCATEYEGRETTDENVVFRRRRIREMHQCLLKNRWSGLMLGDGDVSLLKTNERG